MSQNISDPNFKFPESGADHIARHAQERTLRRMQARVVRREKQEGQPWNRERIHLFLSTLKDLQKLSPTSINELADKLAAKRYTVEGPVCPAEGEL